MPILNFHIVNDFIKQFSWCICNWKSAFLLDYSATIISSNIPLLIPCACVGKLTHSIYPRPWIILPICMKANWNQWWVIPSIYCMDYTVQHSVQIKFHQQDKTIMILNVAVYTHGIDKGSSKLQLSPNQVQILWIFWEKIWVLTEKRCIFCHVLRPRV